MSVTVLKAGLLSTLQDSGRYGYQHEGINPGGAMDMVAANIANALVGNEPGETVLEMHFPAGSFYFEKACMVALAGAQFTATVNNQPVPLHTAMILAAGSTLTFGGHISGARCYLAIQGGWDAGYWLGSYSTNLRVRMGGHHGRVLRNDDVLHGRLESFAFAALPEGSHIVTPVQVHPSPLYEPSPFICCIKGKEFSWLGREDAATFQTASFRISPQSDRMGYRLNGPALQLPAQQLLSSAVTRGTVQLMPDGQLTVLMADHQTTGGYPRVAHVISACMPALAQAQLNQQLQFQFVTIEEAETFYMTQLQHLQTLRQQCQLQLTQFLAV